MRTILIIGAGRSASSLIQYLLNKSEKENLHLIIGDMSLALAQKKTNNHPNATAIALNIFDENQRQEAVQNADIVVSMLPAHLHIDVARDCIIYKKNLVTASYISDAMQDLDAAAKEHNLIFMNEIGLDPGIDHMSAMKVINEIKDKGGKMILFESFCGGLVAPESDNNLWNYKFTWAPRNVVLAGQGGAAKFIQEGTYKYIPYCNLFRRTEFLDVEGYGRFEGYSNRDSLKYRSVYGLDDVLTLYRGTIRKVGFSKAWNMFVQLGMTDDSYIMEDSENMSYREYVNSFLPYHPTDSVEIKMRLILKIDQDDIMWDKLLELDLFNSNKIVGLKNATPAQILEKILNDSWTLQPEDKDMIVMLHQIEYSLNDNNHKIESTLIVKGEDNLRTSMAKTVGLPLGIAAKLILTGNLNLKGLHIPILPAIYNPVLEELEKEGIKFKEVETVLNN